MALITGYGELLLNFKPAVVNNYVQVENKTKELGETASRMQRQPTSSNI